MTTFPTTQSHLGPNTSDEHTHKGWLWELGAIDWLIITIGAALLWANIFTAKPLVSANDRSRWATVWSLVERGTFQIDEIDQVPSWSTIDKVQHEGHLYSSKPPLLSVLVAGVYWTLRESSGLDLVADTNEATRLCLLVVNWLPTVVAFVVFARLLRRVSDDPVVRALALATLCCGTLVTSYATTLNNHSPGAVCLIFALSPLFSLANSTSPRRRDFWCAGFWAASVACFELPAALIGVLAFGLAANRSVRQTAVWLVPAALIPLAAYFVTNGLATGGWKPFYASYGTSKYLFVRDGIPSYWMTPHGLDRNLDSPLMYAFHCIVGHHGILSLSPIFLLTVFSWCRRRLWRGTGLELVNWASFAVTVIVLGFYFSRTSNYNYGGNTFGLRWIIWLSPLWILSAVPVLNVLAKSRWGLGFVLFAWAISAFSAQLAAGNPWGESWLFRDLRLAGWIDYSEPAPTFASKRPLHSWFADIPEMSSVEFVASSPDPFHPTRTETLTLTSQRAVERDGVKVLPLQFDRTTSTGTQQLNVLLDVARFQAGEPMERCLVSFEATPSLTKPDALTLLRGLPVAREYSAGATRYVRTSLRNDAFETQRAATQVRWKSPALDGEVTHRCDLWLCTEIPFGVLQFERLQTSAKGEEISRQRYRVRSFKRP